MCEHMMRGDVCVVLCFLVAATFPSLISSWQRGRITQLYSKSRMPKFNDDDEAELQRISSGVVPLLSLLVTNSFICSLTYSLTCLLTY